ncbi:hypothetical protein MACK_001930 [Theileria orientalis]|uniref:COX assembly mitochondrial protein n=1 Tax=Theileria orientalis TaxID=68886 RepID=A0A976QSP7_THEOR|nr:hypothetical protein MACK_001930 [Theileria orientalis]
MPVTKAPSRTISKDSDRVSLKSHRSNSSRTDSSSSRSHGSASKLRQKLITISMVKHDEVPKNANKGQASMNYTNKVDNRNTRHGKEVKATLDSSNKNLKQTTLTKGSSIESNKRPLTKSISSSIDYEESDYESETPKHRNKISKLNSTNSSSKSTPTKLSGKKASSDDKDKTKNLSSAPKGDNPQNKDGLTLDHDDDIEVNYRSAKIADSNEAPKTPNLNHTLVNSSNVDNLYSNLNEDENDKMNDDFRFKRSKRSHYKLQDSILGLIAKYQADLEHLDEKIMTLEAQFFKNPPETTGLIKGWEGNVLNNAYTNISAGLKSRRALNAKFKANFTHTQNLITEHIFSLTSSTCCRCKEDKKTLVDKLRSANDDHPLSYLEFRESEYKVSKERKEVIKDIAASIRDKCRPEIDEYVNCCTEKNFILLNCKDQSRELHKCIRLYQKDATSPEAIRKVMEERYKKGESSAVPSYLKRDSTGKEVQKSTAQV